MYIVYTAIGYGSCKDFFTLEKMVEHLTEWGFEIEAIVLVVVEE